MAESHVLSALRDKRADFAGALQVAEQRIIQLRGDLATVDRAILIFDPDAKPERIRAVVRRGPRPSFPRGGWTRTVIGVLRRADRALSVREITVLVAEETSMDIEAAGVMNRLSNKVRNTLARQREGLLAREWKDSIVLWRVAE